MSKSSMNKNQEWLNQELVSLVAYTVKAMAEGKGYLTYPKQEEVRIVLQALHIVNTAIKTKEKEKNG